MKQWCALYVSLYSHGKKNLIIMWDMPGLVKDLISPGTDMISKRLV